MSDTPTGNGGEDAKGPFPIVWRRGIPKYDSQTDSTIVITKIVATANTTSSRINLSRNSCGDSFFSIDTF